MMLLAEEWTQVHSSLLNGKVSPGLFREPDGKGGEKDEQERRI